MTQESVRCTDCKYLKKSQGEYTCTKSNFSILAGEVNDRMLCAKHVKKERREPDEAQRRTA